MNQYIFILEIVGTIAFAISGALVAMKSKMDFFGVVIIGVITATFGGIMRDIVLGSVPPSAFSNPGICCCCEYNFCYRILICLLQCKYK